MLTAVTQRQVEGASRKICELGKEKGQHFKMNNDFFWTIYLILEGMFSLILS